MPKTLAPRALTAQEQSEVIMYSLTHSKCEMLEYDETTRIVKDDMGLAMYATDEGWVLISELGVVSLCNTLDEVMEVL